MSFLGNITTARKWLIKSINCVIRMCLATFSFHSSYLSFKMEKTLARIASARRILHLHYKHVIYGAVLSCFKDKWRSLPWISCDICHTERPDKTSSLVVKQREMMNLLKKHITKFIGIYCWNSITFISHTLHWFAFTQRTANNNKPLVKYSVYIKSMQNISP